MVSIYIGDADTFLCANIAKQINDGNFVCKGISHSGYELVNYILGNNPDAVVMDLLLLELDGIHAIEAVRKNGYKGIIIIHTAISNSLLLKHALNIGADYIVLKPSNINLIKNRINMLSEMHQPDESLKTSVLNRFGIDIKEQNNIHVCNLIKKIGISPNLKGYKYVRDAILQYLSLKEYLDFPISKIYKTLAESYHTKPMCIERNIRNAIEVAWIRGDFATINNLFGYSIQAEKGKPTNSEFIAMIADKIKVSV